MPSDQILTKSNESSKNPDGTDNDVCRDFLRNTCKRGKKCKYKHLVNAPESDLSREAVYCHDFQNGICRRPSCKFLHYTRKEEEFFRLHGLTPSNRSSNVSEDEVSSLEHCIPICKDYLNRNCIRGLTCKFRHSKPFSNPSSSFESTINYQVSDPQIYNSHQQYCDRTGRSLLPQTPKFSEPAATVTTPETATAMVAAAAAAGYLALHQKQQQRDHNHQQQRPCGSYHHHQQCPTPGMVVQEASPGTVAVPSASAAAVAAAAAATAIATQQHAPLNHRYSESALTPPTNIPVMQSLLGAVPNSDASHCIGRTSSHSPPTSHTSSGTLPFQYDRRLNSLYRHNQDNQDSSTVNYTMSNRTTKSVIYTDQDVINKSMNSHPTFNQHSQQHHQQQEANTAAALAAAACFGAMLSQPVAAAAAASQAAPSSSVTKPTAGVGKISASLAQSSCTGVHGHANTASASNVDIVLPSPSSAEYGGPAPQPSAPPPSSAAMAAAAAAAVAAAVVSSAGPSAAVAAMSAAHLATSSLSRANSGPHVSCTSTMPAMCASTSRYFATMSPPVSAVSMDHHHLHGQIYSPSDSFSFHMTCPSSSASQKQQQICSVSSAMSSSAATAVYTATMTTAVAAAAMAAAAAVEEHNQKKSAAAAAMAAFNESAALAHEVQSLSRMTELVSLPSNSLPSVSHIITNQFPSSDISSSLLNAEMPGGQFNHRRRIPSSIASLRQQQKQQQQQAACFSRFDIDEDESCDEESNYGDEEDYEIQDTATDSHVVPRISRSCTPDRKFGRNPLLFNSLRKRSYSFPTLEKDLVNESQSRISSQSSKAYYHKRGLPSKRTKLENVERGVTSSRHRIYRRCPDRLQQQNSDVESEMDEEEFCYTAEDANFYSPSSVVTPPSFHERISDLKRRNAQLRTRLKRLTREHKFLQNENRSLMEQNRKLKKYTPGMSSSSSKCSTHRISSRQWIIQSLKAFPQSSVAVSAPKRRKSVNRSSYGQMQ